MGNDDSSSGYGLPLNGSVAIASDTANGVGRTQGDTSSGLYATVVSMECGWNKAVLQNVSKYCLAAQNNGGTNTKAGYIPAGGIGSHRDHATDNRATWAMMAAAIHGAWALVVARKSNSNYATYAVHRPAESSEPSNQASTGETVSAPVRIELSYDQRVSAFLQSVQRQLLDAQSCRDAKVEVDDALQYPASAGNFETLLVLQKHDKGTTLQDCKRMLQVFDLILHVHVSAQRIFISALFDSRTTSQSVAESCLSRLDHVASQLCQPYDNRLLADIEIITPSELKLLWDWNATVPASIQRCVHTIVEEKARDQPTAMAVCSWDGNLTYEMLNQLSTTLASQLVEHGVSSNSLVPLCFHKSKWTSIAILAVLKAGGAFVLLDPSLPEQRLQAIVHQLAAKLVVSSESNQRLSSSLAGPARPVVIVGPDSVLEQDDKDDPEYQGALPSSTCYIVFTSGSTGTPKGIMITHENAASALHHHVQRLDLTAETRIFDFASYSTDVSISNLFLVWAAGGCLCVPTESDRNNNPRQSIVDLRANTIDMTPSLARLLSPAGIPQVTLIIFGGEALRLGDVKRWWGRARIIHEYGSSECTQNSTMNCNATSPEEVIRIGTGAGLVTWVVDPENHNILLPPGSIGELLLEGPLVGRGYLNDPDKTAAAFIKSPTWLLRGGAGHTGRQGRLYKSGDLVQYNEDGSLTFVDRKEGQAKIRGQRVDLGEVEHWVRACFPGTSEVVAEVVLPRGENACSTLVVFLRANGELMDGTTAAKIVPLPAEVEEKLAQHLPSYMIPAALLLMDELPKTATGKMHRSRLRQVGSAFSVKQLAESRTTEQSLKQQPTSNAEHCMQSIWACVLGIDASNIGLGDSFFHLGGDSITAMRVVTEARKAGLGVAVADIFRHRRLQQVAASAVPLVDMVSSDIPTRNDSSPIQQTLDQERIWLDEQRCPGSVFYLKPHAVRLRGPLQLPALETALLALEKRHETLRTTFATRGQLHIQQVQSFQPRELSVFDLSSEAEDQCLENALHKDHSTPFRLETERAWRVSVYRCGQDDHVLSIVMHNLIADGWSVGILSRELAMCYSAAIRSLDPLEHLEPLPIQYGDYSTWQRQQARTAEYQRQLDYRTSCFQAGRPAELLKDKQRPSNPSGCAEVEEFRIHDALYARLQQFCKEREVTLSIVMLSALAATNYRLTGVNNASIGVAISSRDRRELQNLIGLFVNIHCIRTRVENETFDSLAEQVQAEISTAFANKDVPLAEVASKLRNGKITPCHWQFRMVFAFNNAQDLAKFTLEGVKSQHLDTVLSTRDDLEFVVNQEEDGLQVRLYFATDLYERATVSNMSSVFQNILEQGVADPSSRYRYAKLGSDSGVS